MGVSSRGKQQEKALLCQMAGPWIEVSTANCKPERAPEKKKKDTSAFPASAIAVSQSIIEMVS